MRSATRGLRRVVALGMAAVGLGMAFGAPGAEAGKVIVETVGQPGTGAGEFAFPAGVAVNQATGDVYVADADCCSFGTGGQRVLQFDADGDFIRTWGWGVATGAAAFEICTVDCHAGIQGSGDGQFSLGSDSTPSQIAVDQFDGSVYVADNLNGRVQKFSSTGAFIAKFGEVGSGDGQFQQPLGVAVDPVTSDVFVTDVTESRVQRFTSAGAFIAQIGAPGPDDGQFSGPTRVAVDSTGRLYVLDAGNGRVQRFTAAGAFDQIFASGLVNSPSDLAVDPANDHVYVAGQNADFTVQGIHEFDADGLAVDTHAANTGLTNFPAGMAVRSATGRIYATSLVNPRALMILDDGTQPTASFDPVTGVGSHDGDLPGDRQPAGAADHPLQVRVLDRRVDVDAGADDGRLRRFRDVGRGRLGDRDRSPGEHRVPGPARCREGLQRGSVTTGELMFTTDVAAPIVRPLAAGSRSDTAAWLGGEINPQNSQTGYFVEYTLAGDSGYANSSRLPATDADVGSGNDFVTVTQLVTGLAARHRIPVPRRRFQRGRDGGGARSDFTTREALPEPPAGRGYEMVSPLDKNGGDIDRNLPSNAYVTSGAAASGEAVAYASLSQFGELETGAFFNQYRSVRGAEGWGTRGIGPPMKPEPQFDLATPPIWFLSEDLSKSVVASNALLAQGAGLLGGSWGLYLQDQSGPLSTYQLLSGPASPLAPDNEPDAAIYRRFPFGGAAATRGTWRSSPKAVS